jgi:hypothetical protein
MRLIDADVLVENIKKQKKDNDAHCRICMDAIVEIVDEQPTAYDVEKVVAEVKKLNLDGMTMQEDGKWFLVRKTEVISLIQTNGVCIGRHDTCAKCFKRNCPLSTEKTISDKWGEEIRKGGVE